VLLERDAELAVSGVDEAGDVRVVELRSHPFFVATLFQPERWALAGRGHPVVNGLVRQIRSTKYEIRDTTRASGHS
jgi:CTP synthase (UTP-ammonia lyase)